ncbi:hypothetical protein ABZ816_29035 [Actinosynnema sp. NPDC047251]|uniref:PBP domain-containing protein n=1 Tax=Saccharothrix espanaensis (strain ATCC 51144 / DSM 44229 / JCM 9112 / NBRC 15066 / NRRL 15764) TaxID=1179773 RepID=K0JSE4_SACES|nr:hypothetical protein [Saccharothrix espanaensis]CCH28432.1 hypothetical protein BN6_11060 [Saccharothrix espanaensis DSM 44229]
MRRLLLAAVVLLTGLAVWPSAATAQNSSSEVTASGRDGFADLKVTVTQTTGLINQTVRIRWTGGKETGPVGRLATNYLQVMQCWGDDPAGPTREQCQYGGLEAQNGLGLGDYTRSRRIRLSTIVDPAEKDPPAPGAYLPFRSVQGETTTSFGKYFDGGTTNEVPFAKTRPDGTGELDFEVQTALEAYGLGCGNVRADGPDQGRPRHCWLVVVPRGDTEVDGRKPGVDHTSGNLDTSPLSQTNWNARIAVKLEFQPVGRACPLGAVERSLTGHEFVADAMARWQPALCADGGTTYGFTQVPDGIARDLLVQEEPGMVFVADPQAAGDRSPDRPVVYAPVAVSGFAIAFVMERQSRGPEVEPDPGVWIQDGSPIADLKLNARLVAKLLTQSYRDAVPGNQPYLAKNQRRLNDDPEFLDLNPEFKTFGVLMNALDILSPSVDLDATTALWTWIAADADARAFLDGTPDPSGMVVNKNYQNLSLPLPNFPKQDLSCRDVPNVGPDCALLARPLAADLHEAGRGISRGDTLGKSPNGLPDPADPTKPGYSRSPRQPVGERSMLAVVDTATAARYGLPTAALRNASGNYVKPDDAGLTAALGQLSATDVPGVRRANPAAKAADAYPLPSVTYAAAVPAAMDTRAGAEYARFLRYATGPGQTRGEATGQLPTGYLPLPDELREQAADAAAVIERDAGKQTTAPEESQETTAAVVKPKPAPAAVPTAAPAPAAAVPPPAAAAKATSTVPVAALRDTPATPVAWVLRYLLAGLLIAGGVATAAGPVLLRLGGRVRP